MSATTRRGRSGLVVVALSALACSRGERHAAPSSTPTPGPSSSGPAASLAARPASSSRAAASARPAPSSSAVVVHAFDAGTNACRLTYGPVKQPFVGEAALVPTETGVLLVTHHDGIPTVTRVDAPDAAVVTTDLPPGTDAGLPQVTSPPCVVAGASSFCMDPWGAIHRRPLETEGRDVVVARARPGTLFAAEPAGAGHVVLAYLADRKTTEGIVSEAYGVLDEGPPLRLSEEGSGTTHVSLTTRGPSLLALLIDGRTAMTPVHGRTLSVVAGKLEAGEDAVVFVAGGAEQNTRGALAVSSTGAAFGLVPIGGEAGFGLAVVKLEDPPRIDEPVTWSTYLTGLDPAPVAASHGTAPIRVARVRPLEARADAPRGLELGTIDATGAWVGYGLVGSRGRVKSATLAVDRAGALWLVFTDGTGTWLERRACP